MAMTLRDEIQQTKPFTSLQEEALLNVVRTSATMTDEMEELLKERLDIIKTRRRG